MGDAGKGPEEAQDADMENSELGNFSMVDMPVQPSNDFGGPSIEREQIKAEAAAETDPVDAIVANLEAMGFTQRSLNLELLKKNDNDMQRTIDDLVTASTEWDPMLEELEETVLQFLSLVLNHSPKTNYWTSGSGFVWLVYV
jgi:hypothetical protein